MAAADAGEKRDELVARALQSLDAKGVAAAISTIKSSGDVKEARAAFADLVKSLYESRKDVANMILVGEAAVVFCLDHAKAATSPETGEQLKKTAKAMAYNVAANCWPGWGDEGVQIAPDQVQSGLSLANLSRDLVRELRLGHEEEGTAHWLVGALELAAGRQGEALSDFESSRQSFEAGGFPALRLLAEGYCAIARKAEPATASRGAQELAAALDQLRKMDLAAASAFADQLVVADRLLLPG